MFKMLKLLLGVAGLAVFVWVGANIPLGSRTLFEHLQAIGKTRETQDLLDGTKQAGKPIMDGVRRRLGASNAEVDDKGTAAERASVAPDGGVAPAEHVTDADREALRKVLGSNHATSPATKTASNTGSKSATKAAAHSPTKTN